MSNNIFDGNFLEEEGDFSHLHGQASLPPMTAEEKSELQAFFDSNFNNYQGLPDQQPLPFLGTNSHSMAVGTSPSSFSVAPSTSSLAPALGNVQPQFNMKAGRATHQSNTSQHAVPSAGNSASARPSGSTAPSGSARPRGSARQPASAAPSRSARPSSGAAARSGTAARTATGRSAPVAATPPASGAPAPAVAASAPLSAVSAAIAAAKADPDFKVFDHKAQHRKNGKPLKRINPDTANTKAERKRLQNTLAARRTRSRREARQHFVESENNALRLQNDAMKAVFEQIGFNIEPIVSVTAPTPRPWEDNMRDHLLNEER